MLFLLSCLFGNSSSASSERPAPVPNDPEPQATCTQRCTHVPEIGITIGRTGVMNTLKSDEDKTAQELGGALTNESRFHALYHDAIVELTPERGTLKESIVVAQFGQIDPKASQPASQKKSVTFNGSALEREFRVTKSGGGPTAPDTVAAPDKKALERDDVEKIAQMTRKFIWSAKHSVDVLESAQRQAKTLMKEGQSQPSQEQVERATVALEDGRRGTLLMQAKLDQIEGSSTVKWMRQKFLAAGSPTSENGLLTDSENVWVLEFVNWEINAIANELHVLHHLLKALREPAFKPQDSGEGTVESLVKRALLSDGMAALAGIDVPELPQRPFPHTNVVDDRAEEVAAAQEPMRMSFAGEDTEIEHTWAPIRIWGEFLTGLDYLATQIAQGAAPSEHNRTALVTVSRKSAPTP